jgi:CheY-like chemotaxis protein
MAKILIVDDDEQLREMLKQVLEGEEYEVVGSDNGEEAIRILRQSPIDLLITDIIMPKKDGTGLIMEIRKDFPDLQIIAISGGARHIDAQNPLQIAKKLGAHFTFTKPFKLEDLLGAVRELI